MARGAKKQLNERGEYELKVETEISKCPACGGNMVFDPERQTLYCEYCGSTQNIARGGLARETDIRQAFDKDEETQTEEEVVFTCDNCGAKVVLGKNETATECPFCGTGHVQISEVLKGIKPSAVAPFKIGLTRAHQITKDWAKKKFFAPNNFKKNLKPENLRGVYAPCFTFDSKTSSSYYGRIGIHHTRVVGSGKNKRIETYTVWKNIHGNFYYNFNDVLVSAGQKIDQDKIDRLSPFDTDNSKVYDEGYLLGFVAYHYDRGIEETWSQAREEMDGKLRKLILAEYHYDVLDYLNVSTQHDCVTYKYVMLPVYVGNFNYKKKLFNFFINGETGKIKGKTPKSPWKIIFTVLLGAAIAALIAFLTTRL